MEINGTFVNLRGEIHQCYPAFKTYAYCVNSSFFPQTECVQEILENQECFDGNRRKEAVKLFNNQVYAKKLLSIPIYDHKTDSFVSEFPKAN